MTENGAPFDADFLLLFMVIISTGVLAAVVGFIILGWKAFSKNQGLERTYMQVFLRGEALRMLTVTGIVFSVVCLAFAKIIEGSAAVSVLSGIAGYVLGGSGLLKRSRSPEAGPNPPVQLTSPAPGSPGVSQSR